MNALMARVITTHGQIQELVDKKLIGYLEEISVGKGVWTWFL